MYMSCLCSIGATEYLCTRIWFGIDSTMCRIRCFGSGPLPDVVLTTNFRMIPSVGRYSRGRWSIIGSITRLVSQYGFTR